jgi:heme exporter protein D
MYWHSLSDFVAMGGYAFYVWGSYGATAVLIAAELWLLKTRKRRAIKQARLTAELETSNETAS